MLATPAVEPIPTPVTTPPDTVATAGSLVVHTPPGLRLDNVVVLPTHTVGVPVIGNTDALTFTVAVAVVEQEPSVAITV